MIEYFVYLLKEDLIPIMVYYLNLVIILSLRESKIYFKLDNFKK